MEDCPEGKRPALLLTDREDVDEGARITPRSYVVVVNLPHYTSSADDANAATAYMARRLGRGITRARSFSEISDADAAEMAAWLDENLDADALTRWASDNNPVLSYCAKLGRRPKTMTARWRMSSAPSPLSRHLTNSTRA
jgi:hypothetical protein